MNQKNNHSEINEEPFPEHDDTQFKDEVPEKHPR